MKYTFSYHTPETEISLSLRPWWAFWRHDTMEQKTVMVRRIITDLSDDEGRFLQRHLRAGWASTEARIVSRLIGREATMVQLECGGPSPIYVPTAGAHVEAARCNLVANSEPPNVLLSRARTGGDEA